MKKTPLLPRKMPLQKRSTQLVDDILQGAIRVLKQQGGRHFNTIRVADEAGGSAGSLYQYFPNKESILFQIQKREWQETSNLILTMMEDPRYAPENRLRRMILAFFESELAEAELRKALAETGVILDEEFLAGKRNLYARAARFLGELVPGLPASRRLFYARFMFTTISALAEEVTGSVQSRPEVRRWARHCADMILSFLHNQTAEGKPKNRDPK
jgi:AcrR family transcriptional regulator